MSLTGRWISIKSFKHDGSLHRFWDRGLILDNNDDYIVVATKRAKVTENNGRRWFTKEPAVTIFSKTEWWNVICMLKPAGVCFYCNIASPAIVHDSSIKYIDYDLDTKLFEDDRVRILDEKEYNNHKKQYQYGDDLDTVLRYQTNQTIKKMEKHEFPFDAEAVKKYYDQFLEALNKH
ncbi:MAG: DUF402 domain-containing protein [Erysipelotrichaceae bacterium]|jgi:hypothetical protein|nr:DUF402 domain-containing protein [Erysipelotrichaceae bacterium]